MTQKKCNNNIEQNWFEWHDSKALKTMSKLQLSHCRTQLAWQSFHYLSITLYWYECRSCIVNNWKVTDWKSWQWLIKVPTIFCIFEHRSVCFHQSVDMQANKCDQLLFLLEWTPIYHNHYSHDRVVFIFRPILWKISRTVE